jgi:hypothetical protein
MTNQINHIHSLLKMAHIRGKKKVQFPLILFPTFFSISSLLIQLIQEF